MLLFICRGREKGRKPDSSLTKLWMSLIIFYPLMDTAYASLQGRFKELEAFKSTYAFLCSEVHERRTRFKNAESTLRRFCKWSRRR